MQYYYFIPPELIAGASAIASNLNGQPNGAAVLGGVMYPGMRIGGNKKPQETPAEPAPTPAETAPTEGSAPAEGAPEETPPAGDPEGAPADTPEGNPPEDAPADTPEDNPEDNPTEDNPEDTPEDNPDTTGEDDDQAEEEAARQLIEESRDAIGGQASVDILTDGTLNLADRDAMNRLYDWWDALSDAEKAAVRDLIAGIDSDNIRWGRAARFFVTEIAS